MAGMLASAVLNLAGAKLASAVGHQVMMQWELEGNLEDMKDTLESIEAVLKDAERRSIREESVQLWLKRLKNAAYDISDMLDDFQDGKECRQRTGLRSYVPKKIELANRMKDMKDQLRKIQEDRERFQFSRDSGGTIEQQITDQRETISAVNEEDVVGREEEKKKIVELLLERNSKEETIIVPIHGLGGIGKTTLARLVYNDAHFKEYDHWVWVYVSQVLDLKKIGNNIISQVSKQESHLNYLQPIYQRLKELLNGKKCLIVLDDLWEERETELEKLKTMLNVGNAGSKIDVVVTTRKEEIAQKIWTGKSYPLKPLDDTMCWSIIKKRCNFESRTDKEQLEQIGQDIANKCAGIALAAQALGYMLSGMNPQEWSAMRDNYIWSECSPEDTSFPLPSLMLSYKSMPSYLKLCFAYCAIFPKGHSIRKYDLIHQWIALDFIEPSETFSATQLGEKYVRQLQGMSFLHHSYLSPSYEHDSDLPEDNSVSLQLFMVSDVNTCSKLHQLEDVNLKELKISCLENVRSLEEAHKIKLLERRSLSKLTLEWTSDEDRFLEDKDVLGELMPPRGLQHLELDGYSCISFPIWLMDISQYLPNLIEIKLENLPRCSDLSPLGQLPNLDKLHLGRLQSMTKIDRDFCAREGAFLQLSEFTLYDMEQLEEWNTTYCGEDGVEKFMFPKLDKLDIANCPKLRLTPRPPIFRIWKIYNSDMVISSWSEGDHISHSPSNTPGTTLKVWPSKLFVGEWRLLHHLPTLQALVIRYCAKLTSLPENTQHLASLRSLKLIHCDGISALPEWLGHLTSLERLVINKCRSIKSLPHCIQQLTKLKELQILSNRKLEKWCESDENKMKLAHIENISFRELEELSED